MAQREYRWQPGQRERIFSRDTEHCPILDRTIPHCQLRLAHCTHEATVIDHIIPASAGGTNDDNNLRASCWRCNQDRRNATNRLTRHYPEYW